MTYRDENDALRARVEKLEADLRAAERAAARLRGEVPTTSAPPDRASRLLGVETRFTKDEVLPFEISDLGYERIAAVLRERLTVEPTQVGRSLHAGRSFSLERVTGGTRIRMAGDWSGGVLGVPIGAVFSLLMPGLPVVAMLAEAGLHGLPFGALHAVWALPVIASGGALLMRKAGAVLADRGRRQMAGAFEAVLEVARAHAIETVPSTRVAIEDAAEEQDDSAQARRRGRDSA